MVPTPPLTVHVINTKFILKIQIQIKKSYLKKYFLINLEFPRLLLIFINVNKNIYFMPVIKSYYKTTPIDDETLGRAIASAKDQENKIFQIFKKYGCMTTWDVYDVYNEMVGPIIPSSVGRSINTLIKLNIISSIGTIPGDQGRPVNLYELNQSLPDVIERRQTQQIPKSIKLDLVFTEDGDIDTEKIIDNMDLLLSRISRKFNISY
jgi:hypothetical protein